MIGHNHFRLRRLSPVAGLLAALALAATTLTGCFPGLGGMQQPTTVLKASQASFSPDGTRIVFISVVNNKAQIYLADADGSNVRQLTTDASTNAQPAWSPDGSKILFNSNRGSPDGSVFELYIMNADGSDQKLLPLVIPATKP